MEFMSPITLAAATQKPSPKGDWIVWRLLEQGDLITVDLRKNFPLMRSSEVQRDLSKAAV
jgi:hypothetical protein